MNLGLEPCEGPELKRRPMCRTCGDTTSVTRDDKCDAYFCGLCDLWLEPPCEDERCDICARRPARPSLRILGNEGCPTNMG